MSQEQVTLVEIDRRLAMFEPFIPRTEVMERLLALDSAIEDATFWRRIAAFSTVTAILSMVVAIVVVVIGTAHASELLVYQKRCVTPEAAELLITTNEAITTSNQMCIDQHKNDRAFLQAMFASSQEVYKAAEKSGVVYAIGGKNTYEDVSTLPDREAYDSVLLSEEPGRWSGVMVQTMQQSIP